MRKLLLLAAVGVLFSGLGVLSAADDDKKSHHQGRRHVRQVRLKETKTCQNAVIVTKDGKKKTYYLVQNDVAKKAHAG